MKKKVVLAFSGGLDTTLCVKWLQENGFEPICVTLDIGQEPDISAVDVAAKRLGVKDVRILDGKENFANLFVLFALKANALYQGVYPLATALSRPYIGKVVTDIAREVGTHYVAHGCTGKGNDQMRLELAIKSLLPDSVILDPIRDDNMSRDAEIAYLRERGIDLGFEEDKAYSIDQNIWGRSASAGAIEDISVGPPPSAFEWTRPIEQCPDAPDEIAIEFESGKPTRLNGQTLTFIEIIKKLNEIGGRHGIGRIDHIEDRLVGIKSREIYEAPAATILITAHRALETLTLSKSSLDFKRLFETEYARLIYLGDWFSLHHMDLLSYLQHNQRNVTGIIRLKLYKANCIIVGRESDVSLYEKELATYGSGSIFDQTLATGFVEFMSMESRIQAKNQLPRLQNDVRRLLGEEDLEDMENDEKEWK